MKIIVPLVEYYDNFFKNEVSSQIVNDFNEKETLLFESIRSGKTTTDKQAASLLYDGNPSGQAYSKLKQGMLDKLTRIVINYEERDGSDYAKKFYTLYSSYHAYMILKAKNISIAAYSYGQKLLIQAERAGLYEIGMAVARQLSLNAKIFLKDSKRGAHFWGKYEEMKSKMTHEAIVQKEYADLMLLTKKKNYNEKLSQLAIQAEERIRPHLQEDNLRAMQFYYQIRYVSHAAISEHKGVIENNVEAINFFSNFRFRNQSVLDTLNLQLVTAYLAVGQLDKAVDYLQVETNELNDNRWFNKLTLKIRIFFALQRYQEANEHINILFGSVRFKQTENVFQEQMWLYKFYNDLMRFFEEGTKVNTRKIRNNMTRISGDKSGQNVPLLIAEMILSIQQKGVSAIYGEEEKLRHYIKSHLKSSKNTRAIIFIKFLMNLPNSVYDKQLFESNLKNLREEFEENPGTMTTQPDNEVIPYEDLVHTLVARYASQVSTSKRDVSQVSGQAPSDG